MNHLKLIAFDYDGVLADSFDFNLNTFNRCLKRNGVSVKARPSDLKSLTNMTYEQLARDIKVPSHMVGLVIKDYLQLWHWILCPLGLRPIMLTQ